MDFGYYNSNSRDRKEGVLLWQQRLDWPGWGPRKSLFIGWWWLIPESPRDGRFIEIVGTYDPNKEPAAVSWKQEVLKKWLSVGAEPTETVKNLIRSSGVLKG